MRRALEAAGYLFAVSVVSGPAPLAAQTPPPPPPPPYSAPWLLRGATVGNSVRLDETLAYYEDPTTEASGTSAVTNLYASRKLGARWAGLLRQAWIHNSAAVGPSGSAFSNMMLGVSYVRPVGGPWRVTGFTGTALPIGTGSGDDPDPGDSAAVASAAPARSAMDNTLWAVNYWGFFLGGGAARITPALTVQFEFTIMQTFRTRGPETQDDARTNLTTGLHLGHFFSPRFSLGGELRMQRWLSDAAPALRNPSARDQFTFGIGPRFHFKVGKKSWLRPGVSYSRALDKPMTDSSYDIIQIDAPFSF
jgi:hypothetical protein